MAEAGFKLDLDFCPACKRKRIGLAQARTIAAASLPMGEGQGGGALPSVIRDS
jgi:hypothetical protein